MHNKSMEKVLKVLSRYIGDDYEYCSEYGEPGYSNPENGIIFANWNNVPKGIVSCIESRGIECEWSDEWLVTYDGTAKAYRTSPDSYGWTPSFYVNDDGSVIGKDEIAEDENLANDYIEHLLNNPKSANTLIRDLTKYGFTKLDNDYVTGLHPGQNDKPKEVIKQLRATYPNHDILFNFDGHGQFDCRWSAWIRAKEDLTLVC